MLRIRAHWRITPSILSLVLGGAVPLATNAGHPLADASDVIGTGATVVVLVLLGATARVCEAVLVGATLENAVPAGKNLLKL